MQIAVLPLNAGPNSRAPVARQISNFACEIARNVTGQEVHAVNYLAQFDDEGVGRYAMVNPAEGLNESEMIAQFFQNAPMERVMDGLLVENEKGGEITVRIFEKGASEPAQSLNLPYLPGGFLTAVRSVVDMLIGSLGGELPGAMTDDESLFGTEREESFLDFLTGFDAVQYIEKAQGQVAREFDPSAAMSSLKRALEGDRDWEAPYMALLQLYRLCVQFRIGSSDHVRESIDALIEMEPEDPRAWFCKGELAAAMGQTSDAADAFEKAIQKLQAKEASLRREAETTRASGNNEVADAIVAEADQCLADQAPVLARLGVCQAQLGMPTNAERSFKKAVELEGPDKPSMELLANVLVQSGRAHEVPPLWKELLDVDPKNALAHAKYGMSLFQAGNAPEALRTFDNALGALEDATIVKRFYAPILAQSGEADKAMDMYEDCIDQAPSDPQLLLEYAQTLQAANREFEVPKVLRDVLNCNIDQNARANTQAWLLELEQPKRVEAVKAASEKIEAGDPTGAIRELKPLKNWLADYWKMWAVLANAQNRNEEFTEAEESAKQLLTLFPGCEPGYGELATALSGQGRDEEAYNFLKGAFASNPSSLNLAINFGFAAKRTGRADEARELAGQIRRASPGQKDLHDILDQLEAAD